MDSSELKVVNLKLLKLQSELKKISDLVELVDYETPDDEQVSEDNETLLFSVIKKVQGLSEKAFADIIFEYSGEEQQQMAQKVLSELRRHNALKGKDEKGKTKQS